MKIIDKIGTSFNTTNETINEGGDMLDRAVKAMTEQSVLLAKCTTKLIDQRIRIDEQKERIDELVKENENLKAQIKLLKGFGD